MPTWGWHGHDLDRGANAAGPSSARSRSSQEIIIEAEHVEASIIALIPENVAGGRSCRLNHAKGTSHVLSGGGIEARAEIHHQGVQHPDIAHHHEFIAATTWQSHPGIRIEIEIQVKPNCDIIEREHGVAVA